MVFQTHPDHGKHIAYTSLEAEDNIENGWKTVSKDEFYGIEKLKKVFDASVVKIDTSKPAKTDHFETKEFTVSHDDLVELYELKFGKKPHHAMKDETIQAKLDE